MDKVLEAQVRVTPLPLSPTASDALAHLERYDWILFTSKNAVTFSTRAMRKKRMTVPTSARIAAVGPETARALRAARMRVDAVPAHFTAHDLSNSLGSVRGLRILFPRSAIAPPDVVRTLRKRGARVTVIPLYTTSAAPLTQATRRALLAGSYARLSFKSPSGVRGLLAQLRSKEKQAVLAILAECIGPTTARAARAAGFKHVSEAAVL